MLSASPDALVRAIERLVGDSELRVRPGERGVAHVEDTQPFGKITPRSEQLLTSHRSDLAPGRSPELADAACAQAICVKADSPPEAEPLTAIR